MRRSRPLGLAFLLLVFPGASRAGHQAPAATPQDRVRDAIQALKQAQAAPSADVKPILARARDQLEALAAVTGSSALSPELQAQLRSAAADLRDDVQGPQAVDRCLRLLTAVGAALEKGAPLGLVFQGSFSQTKAAEPAYGGHASAMGPAPPDPTKPAQSSPVTFEEAARLDFKTYCGGPTKDHILESGGGGIALFDYDGDGRLDVYLVNAHELTPKREAIPHKNALFRNLGNWKFEDVSARAKVDAAAWGYGVCAGDYDGDGRADLYVTNWGTNLLLRNNGDGTFQENAKQAGVQASGWSTGCSFFDADADGDLDLYVARYVSASWEDLRKAERTLTWRGGPKTMVGPTGLAGEADLFFENKGDGTFSEAGATFGLRDAAKSYGFGVVTTDYDGDGQVDVFVANDSSPNLLYKNVGNRRFESVALLAGVALNADGRAQAGMGADSGDYDGDGRLDFVLTTFAHDTNTLYRNLDRGQFEDATSAAGLAGPTFERLGWGVAFADFDLDGDLDLLFANGHLHPGVDAFPALLESFRQKNQLLLNEGGHFRDSSAAAGGGLQLSKSHRAMAVGDLDDDGDLDVVVSAIDDTPTLLENRQKTGNHWVAFRLTKPEGNRLAIGAHLAVTATGRRQTREVRSGGSYLSQNDLRPHFGLGTYAGPLDVEVRLPGGGSWTWTGLLPDRLHDLRLEEARRR